MSSSNLSFSTLFSSDIADPHENEGELKLFDLQLRMYTSAGPTGGQLSLNLLSMRSFIYCTIMTPMDTREADKKIVFSPSPPVLPASVS